MSWLFQNLHLYPCEGDSLPNHDCLIEQGRISALGQKLQASAETKTIDAKGLIAVPSFIDIQINGAGGVLFNESITCESIQTIERTIAKHGTTHFLPTLITSTVSDRKLAFSAMRDYQNTQGKAALGIHLEGPFISPIKKGAHQEALIRKLSQEDCALLINNRSLISLITLAPETNDLALIQALAQAGINLSAGHSNATYEEAMAGFEAGINLTTHLFNASSGISGRAPGLIGASLTHPSSFFSLIVDGIHLHDSNIRMAHQLKGDQMILVTDAVKPAGTDLTEFDFVGIHAYREGYRCFYEDGTLAGSAVTMDACVALSIKLGIPRQDVFKMASTNPARALGLEDQLGLIKENRSANLTFLHEETLEVVGTLLEGEWIYRNEAFLPL